MDMILFDMDGTLWETLDATKEACDIIVSRNSDCKEISMDTIRNCMGLSFSDVSYQYMPYLEKDRREELQREIMLESSRILSEKGGKVYSNVKETLDVLKEHYKLGIITNNRTEYAEAFVKSSGLDCFDVYLGAASFGLSKGDTIKKVIKDNFIDNAIYVGDTKGDRDAAEDAGIPFVYAKYGFGEVLDYDYSINKFEDLLLFLVK